MEEQVKVCRACLTAEGKMHSLDLRIMTRSARIILSSISGIPISEESSSICYECVNFLYKYEKFREQCIESAQALDTNHPAQNSSDAQSLKDDCGTAMEQMQMNDSDCIKVEFEDNSDNYSDNSSQDIIEYVLEDKENVDFKEDGGDEQDNSNDQYVEYVDEKDGFNEYVSVQRMEPEEARDLILARKDSAAYNSSPFKCDFCYRGFMLKTTFENHIKKHSAESGKFECSTCQLRFHTVHSRYKHVLECHTYRIACTLCPYSGYSLNQAKQHVAAQHQRKEYKCNECDEVFSAPRRLSDHKAVCHGAGARESVCAQCGLPFATAAGLHLHTIKIHKNEENEQLGPYCSECNVKFATNEAWKRHLKVAIKHNVDNKCEKCGEARGRDGRCTQCAVRRRAVSTKSERASYVCEHCGMAFKMRCFLRYHMRKHTGERPYRCDHCGVSFNQPQQYYTHRAAHRHRPQCTICGRVYKYMYGLSKHMRMHLGIRPHKCPLCNKSFINKCDVTLHVRHVHEKQPWPKRVRNKNKHNNTDQQHND